MSGLLIGCRLLPLLNESDMDLVVKSTRPDWLILRFLPSSSVSNFGDKTSRSGERLPSLSLDVDDGGVGGNKKLAVKQLEKKQNNNQYFPRSLSLKGQQTRTICGLNTKSIICFIVKKGEKNMVAHNQLSTRKRLFSRI